MSQIHTDLWVIPWRKFNFDYCGVYIITPEGKWPARIEISEDAASRLNRLQTVHWHQMRIVGYWFCENKSKARQVEVKSHLELANHRMMGEWFDVRAKKAVEIVEFAAETLNIELAKALPETEKFKPVRDHIEQFYEARDYQFDKLGK